MLAAMKAVEFDAVEGMPALRSTGVAVTLANLRGLKLGPAMEMLCRARLMLWAPGRSSQWTGRL